MGQDPRPGNPTGILEMLSNWEMDVVMTSKSRGNSVREPASGVNISLDSKKLILALPSGDLVELKVRRSAPEVLDAKTSCLDLGSCPVYKFGAAFRD